MSKSLYQTNVESRAPLTTDVGVVGNWWVDTSASPADLYLCTDATGGVYTWTKQGGGSGGGVQQDTSATSVETLYTALSTLINNGKQILSIEFTPANNVTTTVNTATTPLTNVEFSVISNTQAIFAGSQKYIMTVTGVRSNAIQLTTKTALTENGPCTLSLSSTNLNMCFIRVLVISSAVEIMDIGENIKSAMNSNINSYTINYI